MSPSAPMIFHKRVFQYKGNRYTVHERLDGVAPKMLEAISFVAIHHREEVLRPFPRRPERERCNISAVNEEKLVRHRHTLRHFHACSLQASASPYHITLQYHFPFSPIGLYIHNVYLSRIKRYRRRRPRHLR